jgi:DNA gyrase subunit A
MCIRFHADQIPVMGRVSGGVKGMNLDLGDRILWAGQPAATDQLFLITERGFAKRVPYMDYEPQARGGKGLKTFYYNKSGSNGTRIAGVALITGPGCTLRIQQKVSPFTDLLADEVMLQTKQDRGMPYVMALMDDVVTGVLLLAAPAAEETSATEG